MYEQAPGSPQHPGHDHKPKDPRNNPIEPTPAKVVVEEPVSIGPPPKPPYGDPQGGGDNQ